MQLECRDQWGGGGGGGVSVPQQPSLLFQDCLLKDGSVAPGLQSSELV